MFSIKDIIIETKDSLSVIFLYSSKTVNCSVLTISVLGQKPFSAPTQHHIPLSPPIIVNELISNCLYTFHWIWLWTHLNLPKMPLKQHHSHNFHAKKKRARYVFQSISQFTVLTSHHTGRNENISSHISSLCYIYHHEKNEWMRFIWQLFFLLFLAINEFWLLDQRNNGFMLFRN